MPASAKLLILPLVAVIAAALAYRLGFDEQWVADRWSALAALARRDPMAKPTVVVIGGGLAGISAARTVQLEGSPIPVDLYVLDKEPSLGGNSKKASSGMNALSRSVGDDPSIFEQDTVASGQGLSDTKLVHRLVGDSEGAIEFLAANGVQLDALVQLGGHSRPRTHSNRVGPNVGFAIMKALTSALEQQQQQQQQQQQIAPGLDQQGRQQGSSQQRQGDSGAGTSSSSSSGGNVNTTVLTGAAVHGLRRGPDGRWEVSYSGGGDKASAGSKRVLRADSVVLATGGYGASKELLHKYAPGVAGLATTNGPFALGEGLGLGQQAGADAVHLDKVQVHPTGLVDPSSPDAGTKFLAPEKLRGVGGLLLEPSSGRRFVDELGRRDVVSAAILALPGARAWLLLDEPMAVEFNAASINFYASKGFAAKAKDLAELAQHMGVPREVLQAELEEYNRAAAAAADKHGKKVFPRPVALEGPYYAMQVTPVIHYTMGGLRFDDESRILDESGRPLPGLYGAGEVTGGLHGANRLGGNSLLECVVFGRAAGGGALRHALEAAAAGADAAGSKAQPGPVAG